MSWLVLRRSACVHVSFIFKLLTRRPDPVPFARDSTNQAQPQGTRREAEDGDAVTEIRSGDLITALDEASLGRFHLRAVLVSGIGFFTDAYDLFVLGIASTLISADWHLISGNLALLHRTMLPAPFLDAVVFRRFAD